MRADRMLAWRSAPPGELRFEAMAFDDVRVRACGDAAVVTGRAVVRGQSPQGPIAGAFRYTRVHVRRDGAWQLVAFQGTPLARPE
jgi:ketosteroid isomerase-like protein